METMETSGLPGCPAARRLSRILVLALLLLAAPAASWGQTAEDEPSADADQVQTDLLTAPSDVGDIDEILRGEEEIFGSVEGYTYDPGERRDPFRSLLVSSDEPEAQRRRPEGIPGLLIDEINLIGIWKTPRGYLAQVQAADKQKSYSLHEGERLFDGEVVSISENEVVFRQKVEDPTALKPFRERVKVLNPDEG
jgi:Tfp pilus assembly protein PilP